MRQGKEYWTLVTVALFALAVSSGCAKRVETAQESAGVGQNTEQAAPETEAAEEATPPMKESDIAEQGQGIASTPVPGLEDAYFDFDKYNIRPDAKTALEADAKELKANRGTKVKIEGHCDERGTAEYNLALGERRAQSAKRFLAALGVQGSRMATISYGKERPVCTEAAEECYQKNRRVHFAEN